MNRVLSHLVLGLFLITNLHIPLNSHNVYDVIVADILAETQMNRWVNWIAALSGEIPVETALGSGKIQTRSSFVLFEPDQNPNAFMFLQDELKDLGFTEGQDYEIHTYDFPYSARHADRNWKNLILTFPGSDPDLKDERVLLVAHLDSTSEKETTLAPGADDNASGSAGLLEAAAVFRQFAFERTLHLIWFSGEEWSRVGSEHFVEDYSSWLPETIAVVNLDMFAYDRDQDRCFEIHAGTMTGSQEIGNLFASTIKTYHLNLTFDFIDDETAYTFSDHKPFWDKGVPAVMVYENGFYQEGKTCGKSDPNYRYHTIGDTLPYINQETGFSILRAAIATVAQLAVPIERNLEGTNPAVDIQKPLHLPPVYRQPTSTNLFNQQS